jgi:hypothetical protein
LSFGCMHMLRSKMSALSGSFGENHTQERRFSFCHVSLFRLF